jgi:hypothetical protein
LQRLRHDYSGFSNWCIEKPLTSSDFFLKKKPPCTILATSRELENRSKVVPFHKAIYETGSSVVSLKCMQEEKQILRLTTPKLKYVWGSFRSG